MVAWIPVWLQITGFLGSLLFQGFRYAFHFHRLATAAPSAGMIAASGSESQRAFLPLPCSATPCDHPLRHAVVVVAYKEPMEVLARTFQSIASQEAIASPPIVVFATEARDETRHEQYEALQKICSDRVDRLILTEHTLLEGEVAGKASNENWAVRELHRQLTGQHVDPWSVMVTIVDADSVLGDDYLALLETCYRQQRDGRRLIYDGPLNTYRNFASGCLLSQYIELVRCHDNVFFDPLVDRWFPLSNYSLTLGFAAEIDFWTVDCIPEDVHTCSKAMINNLGSVTAIPFPGFICNDLVESFPDRYVQAKRHMWGIVDVTWLFAVLSDMPIGFRSWWSFAKAGLSHDNSVLATPASLAVSIWRLYFLVLVFQLRAEIPHNCMVLFSLVGVSQVLQWALFWICEAVLWRTVLRRFPIEHPSVGRWAQLVLLSPILGPMTRMAFSTLPFFDVLFHATFKGDFAYIKAPKGKGESAE